MLSPMQNGHQPVHIAALMGHIDILQHLLSFPGVDSMAKSSPVSTINMYVFEVNSVESFPLTGKDLYLLRVIS